MKATNVFAVVLLALVFFVGVGAAQDKKEMKEMKEISVTGEIIDTKCYLTGMMGGRGPEHEECAIACIKGGLPPGIVEDKTGTVYILVPEKGMKGANEALVQYAAKTVTVKGKVVEKGGSKLLLYSAIASR